ncbi:MAG: hypothetical protein JWP92_1390 [Caulobacter sp.]|nr:hypothetical protein [Caulobacter sp.]
MSPSARATFAVLALAASLTACKPAEAPLAAPAIAPSIADRVQVLSADTLVIDGKHIRLSNAFTPEPIPQARCWAEALAARQTTQWMVDKVRLAHSVVVEPTGGVDEYHRAFSLVRLDGLDLGQSLVDEGLAGRPNPGERFEWCNPISQGGAGAPALHALMAPPR